MADLMVGNTAGVTAVGGATKLADITAEGINTFTVAAADVKKFEVGMAVDFRTKTTNALVAARNITQINSATGVITYDGADAATTTLEGVYLPGAVAAPVNVNGGAGPQDGFELDSLDTIGKMRARLKAIDAGLYTDAYLNAMSYNDMVYAIRLSDAPSSIK